MGSVGIWAIALAAGVAATAWSAAAAPDLHIALTAAACLIFAVLAVIDRQRLARRGGGEAALAAASGAAMAVVWAWAAISLLVIYLYVLSWDEWWQYVLGAGILAALCSGFSLMLARDAATGRRDEAMLTLARYLTMGQLAGMIVAMIGLIIDDKMPRALDKPDWAASTIFFFGAAALAAISANGLRGSPPSQA
jgi:hypothetical protein